jgi:hypothetical protein
MNLARLAPWLSLTAFVSACASLSDVPASTCGNRVIDANEDCDSYAIGSATCGAAGTPDACRLQCTTTSDCPAGWGCGVDGICRAAAGTFKPAFDPIATGDVRLQVGDFDADGKSDVFGGSVSDLARGKIYYFGATGQIDTTLIVPAQMRSPQVVHLAGKYGDSYDDIVFAAAGGGMDMLLGQKDRTVVPVAYPTELPGVTVSVYPLDGQLSKGELPVAGPVLGLGVLVGDEPALGGASNVPVVVGLETGIGATSPPIALPPDMGLKTHADIVDALVTKVYPGSTCGELVMLLAPKAAPLELDVIPVCGTNPIGEAVFSGAAANVLAPARFVFDANVQKLTPLSLATGDMDGDGQVDVIVNVTDAGAARTPLIVNAKTGVLSEFRPTFVDAAGNSHPQGDPSPILATGDWNGDGVTDFVTADDLVASAKGAAKVTYYAIAHNRGDGWTQALLADFNGDGAVDIAASSESRTDVDFFIGSKTSYFSEGTLSTGGVVTRLSRGDFDGDGLLDLGIAARPSSESHGADIFLAYGKRDGLPNAPSRVASFSLANDLASLPAYNGSVLAVIGNTTSPSVSTSLAGLTDDADRFPLASRQPSGKGGIVAVFAGPLTSKGLTDVGAFTGDLQTVSKTGAQIELATAADDAQGDLSQFAPIATMGPVLGQIAGGPGRVLAHYLGNASVPLATGDIDGDGLDETFVVDGNVGGAAANISKVVLSGKDKGLVPFAPAPQRFGVAGKLLLVDVDGDGALDLVYISGFDAVTPGRAPGETTNVQGASDLTVFFNQGSGTFSTSGVALRPLAVQNAATAPSGCATFSNPTAIASLRAQAGSPRLLVMTQQCIYLASVDRSGGGSARSLLASPLSIGFTMTTGDFTGDGVEDVAFVDDKNFQVLVQSAVRP